MPNDHQRRVDFGTLGAHQAYPSNVAHSWGAMLVEPPSIAALRERAASRLVRLGDIAPARSGIPTRVVAYFIVEELTDERVLADHDIRSRADRNRLAVIRDGREQVHVIERAALKPMVRRPGALEGRIIVTDEATKPWKVLYLSDTKEELRRKRWSHTLEYIRYGETTDFPAREGSRRRGGIPAQRPQVRVRPIWFHVPRMAIGPGRICWLKGRGDKHYAPVLDDDVLVPDNFLFSVSSEELPNPQALAASANLSWTHLMAEIHGRRSGGDGVLHTYKRELNRLPLLDPRRLTKNQADDLVGLFDTVAARPAQAIDEELRNPERQAFDLWAMRFLFGSDDADGAARAVERALRDLAAERTERVTSGREQERSALRRRSFDPVPVAARVLADLGMPPSALTHLADMDPSALDTVIIRIPPHPPAAGVHGGGSLFDRESVLLGDQVLVSTPSAAHASIVAAAIRAEATLEGSLALPKNRPEARRIRDAIEDEWLAWRLKVVDTVRDMLPGPQRALRRDQVLQEVERQAGVASGSINAT